MTTTIPPATAWSFTTPFVTMARDNIDTDQIIPARFLTTTTRAGLGPHAFADWRYLADGSANPEFALNRPGAGAACVLVAGDNFGCGSSREHAVWALLGAGFRAVVSSSFADIFRGNALVNGLIPIQVDSAVLATLLADDNASSRIGVDLERCTLTLPSSISVRFPVPPFARHCLLHGIDEMQFLLGAGAEVDADEARHRATIDTTDVRSST